MGQHPCRTLSTPCRVHADELRQTKACGGGVQLNIRKVFLMFAIFSVYVDRKGFVFAKPERNLDMSAKANVL
jgi:hypothetical protein